MNPTKVLNDRTIEVHDNAIAELYRSTNRNFGFLLIFEYFAVVIWAALRSPLTWHGQQSSINSHVWVALLLGGIVALPSSYLGLLRSNKPETRWVIAVCQLLMCSLVIHVSGGRIESHFSIFVSLAFLSFYIDWRLIVIPSLVVVIDHLIRGIYLPQSIYGVYAGANFRFIEHALWVVFEDFVLIAACLKGAKEVWSIAQRQALLETTTHNMEVIAERRSAILDNAMDGIISMDSNFLVTEFNPAAEVIFGIDKNEILGKDLFCSLILEEHRKIHLAGLKHYLQTGECKDLRKRIEVTGLRNKLQKFPIELSINPVHFKDEVMFTAFVRDIEERKRLETELANRSQKMESIGELAAGVAHEINTPNQYIGDNIRCLEIGMTSLMQVMTEFKELHKIAHEQGFQPELIQNIDETIEEADLAFVLTDIPRAVAHSLEGVERVASIVRAMKDFSHLGQDGRSTVDLNRVIESTVVVARNEWKHAGILELDLDPGLPHIRGNSGQLGQVVLNLIINSVHALKERYEGLEMGLIKIKSRKIEGQVEITFSDNGCGIPITSQPRIFEPFYTTKRVGVGTGQGLAISHSVICDHHGGEITFVTKPNEGTTFTILLPIESEVSKVA